MFDGTIISIKPHQKSIRIMDPLRFACFYIISISADLFFLQFIIIDQKSIHLVVESHAQNVKSTHIVCTKKRNDDDISIVSITFCDSNASAKQAIMIEKFKNFWFFLENYQPDKCKTHFIWTKDQSCQISTSYNSLKDDDSNFRKKIMQHKNNRKLRKITYLISLFMIKQHCFCFFQ